MQKLVVGFAVSLVVGLAGCPTPEEADAGPDGGAFDAGQETGIADAPSVVDTASIDALAHDAGTMVMNDAFSESDAWMEPDAFEPMDAFEPPDAFVPDAYEVPDAFTDPDAFMRAPTPPTGFLGFGDLFQSRFAGNEGGGTLYEDPCPVNEVLIGLTGTQATAGGPLGSLRAVCGLATVTGTDPFAVRVTVTPATRLPIRGTGTGGPAVTAMCPSNQVVVGFSGRQGLYMDQLQLRCAAIGVAWSGEDFYTLFGGTAPVAAIGGSGGTPFGPLDCPAGYVATTTRIRASARVDAFALACRPATVSYVLRTSAPDTSRAIGGVGGTPFSDSCPAGSLLVGYNGRLHTAGYIGQIQASCQRFDVVGPVRTPSLLPIGGVTTTPARGGGTGAVWTAPCPAGSAVTGFDGNRVGFTGPDVVYALAPICAPIIPTSVGTVAIGPKVMLPLVGSGGRGFVAIQCTGAMMFTASIGRVGDALDRLTAPCSTVTY